jgi:hypothetical protein
MQAPEGISFLLIDMKSPGIRIDLIDWSTARACGK